MGEDLGHVVYRGPEGETTEWDDIQRRLGNLPPAPEVHKPDAYIPARDPDTRTVAHIDEQTADALEEMDDEFADDAFLERYRRERIAELKARAAIPRFGAVVPITRDAFTSEVTDPSADHHVVVLLHRPGCPDCELVSLAVDELARKTPSASSPPSRVASASLDTPPPTCPPFSSTATATWREPSWDSTPSGAEG